MNNWALILACVLGFIFSRIAAAQVDYPHIKQNTEGLSAPACLDVPKRLLGGTFMCDDSAYQGWLRDMHAWRDNRRIRMGYSDDLYKLPDLEWTQSSYIQPQMMIEDRYFFDPATGKYTVDKYLADTVTRYGGIDSVLIWHTYTNIGIDNRNQYDLLRDMPGGIPAIRQMIADFHRRGVRVLFPIMLWDQGTREEGESDAIAIAKLMKEIGADGINGDTLDGIPLNFYEAAHKVGHPLVLEPESFPGHDEMLAWNLMTWGYWNYPYAPDVSRSKWLESRAMVHLCARWMRDKTDLIQSAFFNGTGIETWENVWGIWNGITARDAEAIRRVATIERGTREFLTAPGWQPYYLTLSRGLFASLFPLDRNAVWTLVNRSDYEMNGEALQVKNPPPAARFFDIYHGVELQPRLDGQDAVLNLTVEPHGYGAVLQLLGQPTIAQQKLLDAMRAMTSKPLSEYSAEWHFLPQALLETQRTKAPAEDPPGMIKLPEAAYRFIVNGIEIEGRDDVGVDVQYPWEPSPRRYHDHILQMPALWMDKELVTNADFKKFIDATRYRPGDPHNFLKDWRNGTYQKGWDDRPVTWVSIEDARAYAQWAGKRLPHEWEWQYAAQGTDGRIYPWGNAWNAEAVPSPSHGRILDGPYPIGMHPKGASPFGIEDLVGNIWQWTDEFQDNHTRAVILRGGSYYQPTASIWYFPQAYKNSEHGKFLLMAPSRDRAGTVGFRCVMDAQEIQ